MATKTFTDAVALPASDINTYLTNGGLVFVKSQTIGSGVGTVVVPDAFNSTYDAYRIVVTGGTGTTAGNSLAVQLTGLTTGYYAGIIFTFYTPAAVSVATINNGSSWEFAGSYGTDGIVLSCDIINPFAASPTFLAGASYANHLAGAVQGKQSSSTSVTGFTLITQGGGTLTGGTINCYGYRKA